MKELAVDPRGAWRLWTGLTGLVALIGVLLTGIMVGAVKVGLPDIWTAVISGAGEETYQIICSNIRDTSGAGRCHDRA